MKKILAMLLAVAMMACLFVGCGNQSANNDTVGSDAEPVESDYAMLQDKGTMVVGITDFAPMDYRGDDGQWTGFDAELARMVAEKLGLECEFIEIDWDNKILELESKSIDCVWNGMTLTDEVLNSMECTDAYLVNGQVIVMQADKIASYADLDAMKDLAIAVESGSAGDDSATNNAFTNVTKVTAQADALMEVASGTADACIIDLTMAKAMTGEGTSYEALSIAAEMDREEYGIGFRKGSDMAQKVNEILAELKADGTMQALADKYGLSLID